MLLKDGEMQLMQQVVRELCGVALQDSKGYLVESRLGHIAERFKIESFHDLFVMLRTGRNTELNNAIIDAITTHETTWFRDSGPYDLLGRQLLPLLKEARLRLPQPKRLRIWSAACSTGQEPYSIAMILREFLPDIASWDIQILATDISAGTVEKAKEGVFSDLDMSRTSRPALMAKYFVREAEGCRVVASVRDMVTFRQRNLVLPFAGMGPFDLVFLRNVLIYFDADTRRDIVERTARIMEPHGYLIAGGSENLGDIGPQFQPKMVSGVPIYQPNSPIRKS